MRNSQSATSMNTENLPMMCQKCNNEMKIMLKCNLHISKHKMLLQKLELWALTKNYVRTIDNTTTKTCDNFKSDICFDTVTMNDPHGLEIKIVSKNEWIIWFWRLCKICAWYKIALGCNRKRYGKLNMVYLWFLISDSGLLIIFTDVLRLNCTI